MSIIYVLVFIFAKVFYCIDVSNETVTVSVSVPKETNGSTIPSNVTESGVTDQNTNLETTTQPLENVDAMQMCNQSFPTPKGTVW